MLGGVAQAVWSLGDSIWNACGRVFMVMGVLDVVCAAMHPNPDRQNSMVASIL